MQTEAAEPTLRPNGLPTRLLRAVLPGALLLVPLGAPLQAQEYNSLGKRDPFLNLRQVLQREEPTFSPPPLSQRPPGLAGLLVSEVIVTGMAVGEESKVALLRGVDNFTYLAREGNKLFDGVVSEITRDEVVFMRDVFDPRGNRQTTTRVVKRLFTEEN